MSTEEQEILDIGVSSNGFLLSDIFLPEEIITNVLIYVDWKDLQSSRLVCKAWRTIVDSQVCCEKLKKQNLNTLQNSVTCNLSKLKFDSIPFHVYFAIANGSFGENLLKNAFGSGEVRHRCRPGVMTRDDLDRRRPQRYMNHLVCIDVECPKFIHWSVVSTSGDGWTVEPEPVGSQPLPAHLPGRSCFVTSYGSCIKEQLITLDQIGLGPKLMDEIQPQFEVSEWYARRWDCAIRYKLTVSLLNAEKEVVQILEYESGQDLVDDSWQQVSCIFKDYGPGVRFILFNHGGSDAQFWAGHYGCKMAGGSVIARLPSEMYERSDSYSLDD